MSKDAEYVFQGHGLTEAEKKQGKKTFKEYKNRYHIDAFSDFKNLEELVFREMIHMRYQKKVEIIAGNDVVKGENIVPKHILKALNDNWEQILILKEKLGLFEEKKGQDPYQHIQILKKKFKVWMQNNQGSRTLVCPHCSKMIMLKIRTEAWEAQKHPFFKDRILANEELWKCYKEGILSKEKIAKILGCSEEYVDWLQEKLYQNPSESSPR